MAAKVGNLRGVCEVSTRDGLDCNGKLREGGGAGHFSGQSSYLAAGNISHERCEWVQEETSYESRNHDYLEKLKSENPKRQSVHPRARPAGIISRKAMIIHEPER